MECLSTSISSACRCAGISNALDIIVFIFSFILIIPIPQTFMRTSTHYIPSGICRTRLLAFALCLVPLLVSAQKETKNPLPIVPSNPQETQMDIPSSFHKYFGQRINNWRDSERAIAKIDLDADLNYDGVTTNNDPQDGGAFEGTPPGLQIGVGEMSRMILRVLPYRVDFDGEVVVSLELSGINRADASGEFESFEEEINTTGRVRVWKDSERKVLLLDSADPNKRYVEFSTQYREYPYNLPNVLPRSVFVEGVKPSTQFTGDLRVLATVSHRAPGTSPESFATSRRKLLKSFRTTFDHVLVTVLPEPIQKEFINNNAEGNWIMIENKASK